MRALILIPNVWIARCSDVSSGISFSMRNHFTYKFWIFQMEFGPPRLIYYFPRAEIGVYFFKSESPCNFRSCHLLSLRQLYAADFLLIDVAVLKRLQLRPVWSGIPIVSLISGNSDVISERKHLVMWLSWIFAPYQGQLYYRIHSESHLRGRLY